MGACYHSKEDMPAIVPSQASATWGIRKKQGIWLSHSLTLRFLSLAFGNIMEGLLLRYKTVKDKQILEVKMMS